MSLAYRFDVEHVGLSLSDVLWQSSGFSAEVFACPGGTESGRYASIDPFEINLEAVGGSSGEHVGNSRARPVNPIGWRRIGWLKLWGVYAVLARLGPSLGCASRGNDCRNTRVRNSEGASCSVVGDVGADVFVEGKCGGHGWCHGRTDVGHSARRGSDGLVAVCLVVSCRLSSRLSICPPPVRPALGISSFPSFPSIALCTWWR